MPKTTKPPAVVLGLSATGLYVARELGGAGVPLLGVDRELGCAQSSKHFRRSLGVLRDISQNSLLEYLLDFAEAQKERALLVPTNDHYIEFLIENYSVLSKAFHLFAGYEHHASRLLNKQYFDELCQTAGIPTPKTWLVGQIGELPELSEQVPYPCILKPQMIHRMKEFMQGKKVVVLNSQNQLLELAKTIPEKSGGWLLQEVIPGEESRITLVGGYQGNQASGSNYFTARKLRQYPPGFGSASTVISENLPESLALTKTFMETLEYEGIFGAEFKLDPRDNVLKFIEVNPRPTLWFYASHAAGMRLILSAYCTQTNQSLPASSAQEDGVLWRYAIKDLASAVFYKLNRGQFIFSVPDMSAGGIPRRTCWPVFDVHDPLPALTDILVYLRKSFKRLL